jgi:hypothetical protein
MNRIYLYRKGRLSGPHALETIEQMRATGEFYLFSWWIEEQEQLWKPIEPYPSENPFSASLPTASVGGYTGAFIHRGLPLIGSITQIDSYGVEMRLSKPIPRAKIPNREAKVSLNVTHEQTLKSGNYSVLFENLTLIHDGVILRFTWQDPHLIPTF